MRIRPSIIRGILCASPVTTAPCNLLPLHLAQLLASSVTKNVVVELAFALLVGPLLCGLAVEGVEQLTGAARLVDPLVHPAASRLVRSTRNGIISCLVLKEGLPRIFAAIEYTWPAPKASDAAPEKVTSQTRAYQACSLSVAMMAVLYQAAVVPGFAHGEMDFMVAIICWAMTLAFVGLVHGLLVYTECIAPIA